CRLMLSVEVPNSSAICAWLSQTVSPSSRTSTDRSPVSKITMLFMGSLPGCYCYRFQLPGQRERLQPAALARPGQQLEVDGDAGHASNASTPSTKTRKLWDRLAFKSSLGAI